MLCSEHLKHEDFVRSADLGDEQNLDISKRWLRTDDFGVCVFHSVLLKKEEFQNLTEECCENSKQHREVLLSTSQLDSPQVADLNQMLLNFY